MILKLIISKGALFCKKRSRRYGSHSLLLYICTKFHKNILDGIKVIEQTKISLKNFKGHNFTKNVGGVTVLVLCTHCLILVYFSTQFHENIFDGF